MFLRQIESIENDLRPEDDVFLFVSSGKAHQMNSKHSQQENQQKM